MSNVRASDRVLSDEVLANCERLRAARAIRIATDAMTIGGGVACRHVECVWANVAVGMGLGQAVAANDIARLVEFYDEIERDARIEVADRAPREFLGLLADSGFRLRWLVTVLFGEIVPDEAVAPEVAPEGIRFEPINPADEHTAAELAQLLGAAFASPEHSARASDIAANTRQLQHAAIRGVVAFAGTRPIGVGFMDVSGDLAALWGAAVAPEFRRRGVHSALLNHRLSIAKLDGARYATIESDSGGATHRNAARLGFGPAFTRAVMVRTRSR